MLLKKLYYVLLLIVTAFVFILVANFFNQLFQANLEYVNNILGAFMGAFFAFIFLRIAELFKDAQRRIREHHNALIRLDYLFNDYHNIISDNDSTIDRLIEKVKDSLEKNYLLDYHYNFRSFPIEKETLLKLMNIDLINRLYSLNVSLTKMNDDLNTMDKAYLKLKQLRLEKRIGPEVYKINMQNYLEQVSEVRSFISEFEGKIIGIHAIVRILIAKKSIFIQFNPFISKRRFPKNLENELIDEKKKLLAEMKKIQDESRKEIKKVLDRKN